MGASHSSSSSYERFAVKIYIDELNRAGKTKVSINNQKPIHAEAQSARIDMFGNAKLEVWYSCVDRVLTGRSNLPHSLIKWQNEYYMETTYSFPKVDADTASAIRKKQLTAFVLGKQKQKENCAAYLHFFRSPIFDRNVLQMIAEQL